MNTLTRAGGLGAAALLALGPSLAFAQSTTTPSVPDTGVGGDAIATLVLLAGSAALAVGAAFYLANRKAA